MKHPTRNVVIVLVILFILFGLVYSFFGRSSDEVNRDISSVVTLAKNGEVSKIDVNGNKLTVTLKDGTKLTSRKEEGVSIVEILSAAGVQLGGPNSIVISVHRDTLGGVVRLVVSFLPLVILGGVLVFFISRTSRFRKPPSG